MKSLPRILLVLVAPWIVAAENIQPAGHADVLPTSGAIESAASSTVVYSSARWIVSANTSPGPESVRIMLASGKSYNISNGIISTRTITHSLIDRHDGSMVFTHRAVYDGYPEVLGVLKDGTLILGVQRAGPCIQFIGTDGSIFEQELLIDGEAYDTVFLDDEIVVLRRRVSEGAGRAVLVPVRGRALDVARRIPLMDEKGTPVDVSRSIRFERIDAVLRWQDAGVSHSSNIPISIRPLQ